MKFLICFLILIGLTCGQAQSIEKLSLPLVQDIQRADLYSLKVTDHPQALLILCPGVNEVGKGWLENSIWQKFAIQHNLNLIGLSFASAVELLPQNRGYYKVSQGSGQLLLGGIRRLYSRQLPLILYGFSGGAHFVSGFTEWRPDKVLAWCAYSAGWWNDPTRGRAAPPGLIACGENDPRLAPSMIYFKQGRALGKPWLWLCVPKTAHSIYPPAEDFARNYFAAVLHDQGTLPVGEWVDLDEKSEAKENILKNQPSLTGWLPDKRLLSEWQEIHQP